MLMIAAPWPRSPRSTEASINAMWVIVAGVLVMFRQAGFLLLEVGFSRAKNAGAGVAKVIVNCLIASPGATASSSTWAP